MSLAELKVCSYVSENGHGLIIEFDSAEFLQMQNVSDLYCQELKPYIVTSLAEDKMKGFLSKNKELFSEISWFREKEKYNYLVFKNCFSTKNIPPTPTNDCPPDTSLWRAPASSLLAVISITGHKVASYEGEMSGRLAHMVMPAKNSEASQLRSTKQLSPHTEVVNGQWAEMLPQNIGNNLISPEIFGLCCLRNPDGAGTTTWYLSDMLDHLPYSVIQQLCKPEYSAKSQSSFDYNFDLENISVISEINGKLCMRYSSSKLVGLTDRASNALSELEKHLNNPKFTDKVVLEPGDIFIVNNRITLHGRESLTHAAKYDGTDRWLLRMYGFSQDAWRKLNRNPQIDHVAIV
ncbi:TauD/TfdA family dioxygenase [Xenorhabdus lircayensis]|uniref:TauD/TfdA family dioxygenase n=1 Tax=Xenorhabdus lircayensis TaxID=2763499 RepID=A0ABS0UA80_9GAMM|nr:TauD/TfdA family dioxygenase [Xenorhabdus lircayensis]MBI6549600.1 TauD/TfdA family dioxygenase [Xenorhabdus lircayensis]